MEHTVGTSQYLFWGVQLLHGRYVQMPLYVWGSRLSRAHSHLFEVVSKMKEFILGSWYVMCT